MPTDIASEFDLGPLSWVQGEIDQALSRGLESLTTWRAQPDDLSLLKHARTHVHQAAGAIQMVGLDAVVAYTDEIERQLGKLEEASPEARIAIGQAVDRACRKLRIFLDELVAGSPPVPLKLFPEYETMQRLRGIRAASPTDLFYPDLSTRAPNLETSQVIAKEKRQSYMIKQRRMFQRGLLAWLRGGDDGAKIMRDAVAGIENATAQANLRAFWWTTGALVDAFMERGLEPSFGAKQLAARIDLQIRRVVEGSAKVADRLRREVLYYLAISAPVTPAIQAVQRGFRLAGLIPSIEVLNADLVRIQPLLREARDLLTTAKDLWLKYTSGRAENLPKLRQTLTAIHKTAAEVGNGTLMKLTALLVERLDKMPANGIPEALAMEYATALLLAESAIENFGSLSADFAKQVDAMIARLDAARAGRSLGATPAALLLDEMAKRAQERMLLAHVAREIQANLRHIEQVLDAFFRDHSKNADLATLAKDGQQIRGALQILGLPDADRLLVSCLEQIAAYALPNAPVTDDDLELLAESLSGLGFYIEAVEQQRPDRERLIAPLIARREGPPPAVAVEEEAESVEVAVRRLQGRLPDLVAQIREAPADAAIRQSLAAELATLRDDADLIGNAALVEQVEEALRQMEAGPAEALEEAVSAIAESGAPAPAPAISEETQRLLATDEAGFDQELLEIYLTEAAEVLDTIADRRAALAASPADRDALTTIRRGFHTLKGSGRMVGLMALGEIAWDVERIHNRLLDEDHPVTPAVLAMIAIAGESFRRWVDELTTRKRVTPDPAALQAAIRAVEAELPSMEPPPSPPDADDPRGPPGDPTPPSRSAEVIELRELGDVGTAQSAHISSIVDLADVAFDGDAEIIDFASIRASADVGSPMARAEVPPALPEISPPRPAAADAAPGTGATPAIIDAATFIDLAPVDLTASENIDISGVIDIEPVEAPFDRFVPEAPMIDFTPLAERPAEGDPAALAPDLHESPGAFESSPVMAQLSGRSEAAIDVGAAPTFENIRPEPTNPPPAIESIDFDFDDAPAIEAVISAAETPLADIAIPAADAPADEVVAADLPDEISDEITIGDVKVSAALHAILVDEAAVHLSTLAHELSLLEFDPKRKPSEAMVRASHTLCGIHRTGGFELVATTAKALEQSLLGLQSAPALPSAAYPALARSVVGLHELVGRVSAREPFDAGDVREAAMIQQELESLRLDGLGSANEDDAANAISEARTDGEPAGDGVAANEATPAPPGAPAAKAANDDDSTGAAAATSPLTTLTSPLPDIAAEPRRIELPEAVDESLALVHDDVDDQLLPIFLEEAAELFLQAGEQIRNWSRHPADLQGAQKLRRTLHTFKGSARMAGAMRLGELTHFMESRLLHGEAIALPTTELFEALDTDLDRVAYVLDALREGRANIPLPWIATAADAEPVAATSGPSTQGESVPAATDHPTPTPASRVPARVVADAGSGATAALPSSVAIPAAPAVAEAVAELETGQRAHLRVRADVIDRLVTEAGEVAITRARVEGELRLLKANLLELTGSVIRLRSQVREIEIQAESQIQSRMSAVQVSKGEFDPLEFDRFTRFQELTRSLAEGVNDVSTVQQSLLKNLDDADSALLAQARMSRDVQQQLFSIRTVPFGSLTERLYRILRQTAKELDKRANLEIQGAKTELDRSVLEKLVGPLEHLLRNSLDHGIESREARLAAGKPETGEISLNVRQVGNEVAIELADDGAGIDIEQIRRKAVGNGRLAPDAQPTAAQLIELIFEPGFTTATRVTQISGRGIGMDVVRSEIVALGGRVEVTTRAGEGTRFLLYLPLTLAVAQAVLVRAGGRLWAMPAPMVEQVQQVKAEALLNLYVTRSVEWKGRSYPFFYLPRLLGDMQHNPETGRYNVVVLLRAGHGLAAVHVDEMVGNQEVVVKNIGPQLVRVPGIVGATVLGSGEIVLILNPVQLAQRPDVPDFDPDREEGVASGRPRLSQAVPTPGSAPLVMVVDDSLTVRKITTRLLTREGLTVVTAKDGVDALQVLGERIPDVILLDIEMPRMDGFEFTRTIKNDRRTAHIPIIMITSRTAEKHRNHAKELGVDLYLGKPFQEEELLRILREMLELPAHA